MLCHHAGLLGRLPRGGDDRTQRGRAARHEGVVLEAVEEVPGEAVVDAGLALFKQTLGLIQTRNLAAGRSAIAAGAGASAGAGSGGRIRGGAA